MIPQVRLFKGIVAIFQASLGKTYYEELTNVFDASLIAENGLTVTEANALLVRLADSALGASVLGNTPVAVATQLTRHFGLNPEQVATDAISREAFNFFQNGLQRGESAGALVVEAINFLESQTPDSPFYDIALLLDNRSRVAEHHSMVIGDTSTSLAELQAVLAGITADPATVFSRIGELNAQIEGQSSVTGNGTPVRDDVSGNVNTSDRLALGDGNDLFRESFNRPFEINPTPDGRRFGLQTSFNQIDLGDGDDMASGGYGVDVLVGGRGNDEIIGEAFNSDLENLTDFQKRYFGLDFINGGEGDDDLQGLYGDDLILGAAGNDEIHGDEGDDRLDGGDGNDTLFGGDGNDILLGGAGNDVLNGDKSRSFSENVFADFLDGGDGADTLIVGPNDRAFGGNGGDLIEVTTSNNPLREAFVMPGDGADLVTIEGVNGNSSVTIDFSETVRGRDLLDLSGIVDGLGNQGRNSFVFKNFTAGEDGLRLPEMNLNGVIGQTANRGKVVDSNGTAVNNFSQTLDSVGEQFETGKGFFLVNFQKIAGSDIRNSAVSLIDQLGANHTFDALAKHFFAIEIEDQGLGLFTYQNQSFGPSNVVSGTGGLGLSLLGIVEGLTAAQAAAQDFFAV